VLTLAEAKTALTDCAREVCWKPAWPGQILCVPLSDEGLSGGVEVPAYKQRHIFQGLVVSVNKTRDVKVGDLINFDMGRGEAVTTYLGETLFHVAEDNASGVDDEFGKEPPPPEPTERQLPSGLWIATE
jgi:hypothetical protein